MSNILSGQRFNATSLTPSIDTSNSLKVDTSVFNEQDLAQQPVNVNVNQMWDGGSVKSWIDEKDASKAKMTIKKRG